MAMMRGVDGGTIPRREFLAWGAVAAAAGAAAPRAAGRPRVAGLATAYHHNSHAEMLIGRLVEGYTLDGKGEFPAIDLASLYLDQRPANDTGALLAKEHGIHFFATVTEALTLGTGRLAVDGVLLVAEHGDYPRSPIGSLVYPKRRLFAEVVEVFRRAGRSVPVFIDKHLADNREDIAWIDRTARELGIPLMAGSVLPETRREPPDDVELDAPLEEILVLSYGPLDAYGFHALEVMQCLAERRRGGETGVRSVQSTAGRAAGAAIEAGAIGDGLLAAALARSPDLRGMRADLPLKVPDAVLWRIEYADGLRGVILNLRESIGGWSAAWQSGGRTQATGFDTREDRPMAHFAHQLRGVEAMILTGRPTWPVARTVLTSGLLEALLTSAHDGGLRIETQHLAASYRSDWKWRQPPAPPGKLPDGR